MNPVKRRFLLAGEVRSWLPRLLACGLLAFSLAGWSADELHAVPDLTVHEWGTFTAIAGTDGRAMLNGNVDSLYGELEESFVALLADLKSLHPPPQSP